MFDLDEVRDFVDLTLNSRDIGENGRGIELAQAERTNSFALSLGTTDKASDKSNFQISHDNASLVEDFGDRFAAEFGDFIGTLK